MIIEKYEQRSPEWYEAHKMPTASRFSEIVTPTGKLSKSATKYAYELAGMALGNFPEKYTSPDMQRGIDLEPEARVLYQMITGNKVYEVGFIHNTVCGCSPDGLIRGRFSEAYDLPKYKKGLEIKSPKDVNHIETLDKNEMPSEHTPQVQGSMLVTGFKEWDFMSYHPDYKPLIVTIKRDNDYINKLRDAITTFNDNLCRIIKMLESRH